MTNTIYNSKDWYKSKGIWGGIIMIVGLILGFFGIDVGADEQAQIVDQIVNTVSSIMSLVGSIMAIYGRVKAKSTIK